MPQTFIFRHQAAAYAREQGWTAFHTSLTPDGNWKASYEPGENLGQVAAQARPDVFGHGETVWVAGATGDEDPHKVGLLVCTPGTTLDELRESFNVVLDETLSRVWVVDESGTDLVQYIVEPDDAQRWDVFTPKVGGTVAGQPATAAPGDREGVPARAARSASSGTAPIGNRSTAESPTKRVWAIADGMPGASRADVVAACVAQGINRNTAGTQYHHWSKAKQVAQG
jgi:hypothetical protein